MPDHVARIDRSRAIRRIFAGCAGSVTIDAMWGAKRNKTGDDSFMRQLLILLALAGVALAACDDNDLPDIDEVIITDTPGPRADTTETQPPTQIVMVITATPEPGVLLVPMTFTPQGTPPATTRNPSQSDTPAQTATSSPSATPSATARPPSPTPRPAMFPTDTAAQVALAEQIFQNGRMFWLRYNRQIWVMVASEDDPNVGDWYCYYDTFREGEQELDPDLIPPQDAGQELYQPRRGFGKLWRNNPQLKNALGWAITPEFELTSAYRYIAGGTFDADGNYISGPGEHRLTSLYKERISFYEEDIRGDCLGGSWQLTPNPQD